MLLHLFWCSMVGVHYLVVGLEEGYLTYDM